VDVEQLAEGLWRWTTQGVGCVYYEAPDAVVLFDPLVPAGEEEAFLPYLDRDVERLGLPLSILLTDPEDERSASFLRERYRADDRVPPTVDAYPLEDQRAYFIRPHRALVVGASDLSAGAIRGLPVELVLATRLALS
jgi:hypothetical protein